MKTKLFLFISLLMYGVSNAQFISIPDPNFEKALIDLGYDAFIDGKVHYLSIQDITDLDISNRNISSIDGIAGFKNLRRLFCRNNNIVNIDISQNPQLSLLSCENNKITALKDNSSLLTVICDNNKFSTLDLSKCLNLGYLSCSFNNFNFLDLTKYLNLEGLNCSNNNLSTLNTQNNIKLKNLVCSNNMITVLNVNPSLSILDCSYNKINVLDLTKNIGLIDLNCRYNNLTNLTFNGTSLDCSNNNLKSLQGSYKNISNLFNPSLEKMICNNNEIVSLDLSYNGSLKILDVSNNKLTFLDMLNVGYKLDKFNATGNADLRCIRVYLTYIFIPNFPTAKDVTAIYSQNCAALRVEDFNADNFIKIYPNPTKDLLHLDLQNELSGIITDLTGKTLMNVNTKDVDVSSLSAGIYLLEVTSEGKHYVSKIVKQ